MAEKTVASLSARLIKPAIALAERGALPDMLTRRGIAALVKSRLAELQADDCEQRNRLTQAFIRSMAEAPVAVDTEAANAQHYEVPAAFFSSVLGVNKKYSACYWQAGTCELDQAEDDSLRITAERAGIENGMRILDLGCGWGSFSLMVARRYPASHITAVSNSHSQKQYILDQARQSGLDNIAVVTADMNTFDTDLRFDRIVSIEMFEHIRNHAEALRRIAGWLREDGRFFMHIFCHRGAPYYFTAKSEADWMSRYFFSGGMMPADDLPLRFQRDLSLLDKWRWDGTHYAKTAAAWLRNMDADKDNILRLFSEVYGREQARKWWHRWRIFFLSCAVLFGYHNGQQWWVSHYLFAKRDKL